MTQHPKQFGSSQKYTLSPEHPSAAGISVMQISGGRREEGSCLLQCASDKAAFPSKDPWLPETGGGAGSSAIMQRKVSCNAQPQWPGRGLVRPLVIFKAAVGLSQSAI